MSQNKIIKKRNYPKFRKPRNLDNSPITKLINTFGFEKLKEICTSYGVYKGAKVLTKLYKEKNGSFVDHTTVRYLRQKYSWIRVVSSREDPNVKSLFSGKRELEYFKTITFSEDILEELKSIKRRN